MKRTLRTATLLTALLALAWPAAAQDTSSGSRASGHDAGRCTRLRRLIITALLPRRISQAWKEGRPIVMQYYRPQDKRGINIFETTEDAGCAVHRFQARHRRGVRLASAEPDAREHGHAGDGERGQRQSAGRHRLRLQQPDRQSLSSTRSSRPASASR